MTCGGDNTHGTIYTEMAKNAVFGTRKEHGKKAGLVIWRPGITVETYISSFSVFVRTYIKITIPRVQAARACVRPESRRKKDGALSTAILPSAIP